MNLIEKVKPLDLNVSVPRSSKETMAGIAHLPRMVDKARAYKSGNLGEYIYPCPLDQKILNFLGVDPEFLAELAIENEDGQISIWAEEQTRFRTQQGRDRINAAILDRKPDENNMSYFIESRNLVDPSRTDVTTWVDLIDLEEGRL